MKTVKKNPKMAFLLFLTIPLIGLQNLSLIKEGSEIKITGTSSLHEWEEFANTFSVKGTILPESITGLEVTIDTKSIESGKDIMDEKTHEALLASKYTKISLSADKLTINGTNVTGLGQLQIAGKTKTVKIQSKLTDLGNNTISVSGTQEIKMTDYGIDPPTAMFGTLTTGNDVTVHYTFKLKKN